MTTIVGILLASLFALFAWRNLGAATRLLVAFLPLQFAFNLAPGLDLASSRVFALILGLIWLIKKFPKFRLPYSLLPITYTLFIFWAGLSLIGAPLLEPGLRKFAFLLSYLPLLIVLFDTHKNALARSRLARAAALSGTIAAVAALIPLILAQFWSAADVAGWWLSHITPIFNGATVAGTVANFPSLFTAVGHTDVFRAFGLFPVPLMLAFFLELTMPLTIALAIVKRSIQYSVFSILQIFILLLTFSRGAYIGIAVVAFVFLIILALKNIHNTRYVIRDTAIGAIALLAVAFVLVPTPILGRFKALTDRSAEARLELWQEASQVIKDHPVRGIGLGNLPFILEPAGDYRTPAYAHNLYLDITAELGLVGLILWLAFLVPAFRPLVKKNSHAFQLAAALSILAFSTHALFDTPIFSPIVLPMLLVILTLAMSTRNEKKAGFGA